VIRVTLVEPEEIPHSIDAIAIHHPGDVIFIMRRTLTAAQVAEQIARLGARMSREAVDATVHRSPATTQ
jgi:hypothetical protein